MEALEKLFGSSVRVKVLRLFLLNDTEIIEKASVVKRAKITSVNAVKELNLLEKIGFLKKRSFFKEVKQKSGKTSRLGSRQVKKMRSKGYIVNDQFKLLVGLQNLLLNNVSISSREIEDKLSRHGKIKVIITAGIFIQDPDSRVDLLIVADDVKHRPMKSSIAAIEAEVGKEIRYAIFNAEDFKYRLGIYDRLIRDVLDYPHEIIVDKMGV
jgi:hypothetical protein